MDHRRRTILALGAALSAAGCGNFVEPDADRSLVTLDRGGGAVEFRDFRVSIPPMALDHPTTFEARFDAPDPSLASATYHLRPDDLAFPPHVRVSISFDAGVVAHAEEMYLVLRQQDGWLPLDGHLIEGGRASADAPSTGIFGLLRCPAGACGH